MHEIMLTLLLVVMVVLWRWSEEVKSALVRSLSQQPAVVVTDRVTAHRLLIRGSAGGSFCSRPTSAAASAVLSRRRFHNLNSVPYGPLWRVMRRNITADVLHPLHLHRYAAARRHTLRSLIADHTRQCTSTQGGLVLAAESIRSAIFALMATMCFGDGVDAGHVRAMADAQRDFVQLFLTQDVFSNSKLPGALARTVYREQWRKLATVRRKQEEMYFPLIDARRSRRHRHSGETVAYVDTLIDLSVPDPDDASNAGLRRRLSNAELVGLCSEFLGAGTEAVAAGVQWIMAYLVKRPALQEAVRKEIDHAVGADADEVSEELLEKMEYLNAVILEALRLHPTVPFVFRQVMEGDNVVLDGRPVPAGTVMKFPPGCLALDETAWADPNEFKPERFLGSSGGERLSLLAAAGSAGEIKMMPFGAGRRMCPGMSLAMLHLAYFTANLVREFEWREAGGELAVDLEPNIAFFTVMKQPLRAQLLPRREDKDMMHV